MDKDDSWIEWDREQRFTWTVFHVKGYKKGHKKDALNEAIDLYIEKYKDKVPELPPREIP